MDEQLRNLIEGAKKQGATDNDVKKIIDMYILDQKKKGSSEPISQERPGVSPTRTTTQGTSLDTEQPTRAQASVTLGGPTKLFPAQEDKNRPKSVMYGDGIETSPIPSIPIDSQPKKYYRVVADERKNVGNAIKTLEDKNLKLGRSIEEIQNDGTYQYLQKKKNQLDEEFKPAEVAIREVKKEAAFGNGILERLISSATEGKYSYLSTETIKLDNDVEDKLIDLFDNAPEEIKQKWYKGALPLEKKEELINAAKTNVLNTNYKKLKEENKYFLTNIKDSSTIPQEEKIVAYNILKAKNEAFDAKVASEFADNLLKDNFKATTKSKDLDEAIMGRFKGFLPEQADVVSTFLEGMGQVAAKVEAGIPEMILMGGERLNQMIGTSNKDDYTPIEATLDLINDTTNLNFLPSSKIDKGKIVTKGGDFNINLYSIEKSLANTLPFTLKIMNDVKKGRIEGAPQSMISQLINPKYSKGFADRLRVVETAYKATIGDNYRDAKDLGMDDSKAYTYANVLSLAEGVSENIMPDFKYFDSLTGATLKSAFKGSLKSAATKQAVKNVTKDFFKNVALELGEEEFVLAVEDGLKYSLLLNHKNSEFFNLKRQKELLAATVIMSGGMGVVGAPGKYKQNKTDIYKEVYNNINNLQDSFNTEINSPLNDEKTKQTFRDAYNFASDVSNAIAKAPENVTADQVDLLVQKNKLEEKKKTIDAAFHPDINEEIAGIDAKIRELAKAPAVEEVSVNAPAEEVEVKTEAIPTEEAKPTTSGQRVSDVLNRPATLESFGGTELDAPLDGNIYLDGQRVIFEDNNNKTYDLGNVDEISDTTVEELGIKPQTELMSVTPEGKIKVGDNTWNIQTELPNNGVEYDADGNVKAVSLKDDNGKTIMYEGQIAEDIAYQTLLIQAQTAEQRQAINEILENDEELNRQLREAEEAAAETTGEVVEPSVTETEVTATEEIAPSEIETTLDDVTTPASSNIKEQIARAKKAISKFLPNVDIVYHTTSESFKTVVGDNSRGYYDPNTKKIHINGSNATNNTVAHEVFHAVILKYISSDKQATDLTNRMFKALAKSIKNNPKLLDNINKFAESYSKGLQSEEKLSEILGYLASEYETLPDTSKNIIQKWIEQIAKMVGIKKFTDQEVVDFMNTIATKVAYGQEVTEADVANVLGTGTVSSSNVSGRSSKFIDSLIFNRFPTNKNTKVLENFDLSSIDGQVAASTLSDKLTAGELKKYVTRKGEKILEATYTFFGGVGYPEVTGYVWAASTIGGVKKIIDDMKVSSDGYRYLIPAVMSNVSHMSNKNMTSITMEVFKEAINNNELNRTKFKEIVSKAFDNKKTTKFKEGAMATISGNISGDKMVDNLREYILSSGMTFESRKDLLQSMVGNPASGNPKFSTVGTFLSLAKSLSEPMAKDAELYQVPVIIRTKGNLTPVKTNKSDKFYHESYGYHIESDQEIEALHLDGIYNLTDIVPEFTKEDGTTVSTEKELKEKGAKGWDIKRILTNLGRTHGLSKYTAKIVADKVSKRKQKETYLEEQKFFQETSPFAWAVDEVSAETLDKSTIVENEGTYGVVTPDGDIKGVFNPNVAKVREGREAKKGTIRTLIEKAVAAGGIKLDNFDGRLTKIYSDNGFREVSRVPFNEEYAPEGWNKEDHGTPDVVAMIYDPEGKIEIEEKSFTDYDEAMNYRDSYVEEAVSFYPTEEVSGRRQLSPIDEAVKVAKNKGFSDKNIADYLVGKGYTRAQATKAILRYNDVTAVKLRKEESVFTKDGRNKVVTFLDQVKRRALSARSFLPKSVFIMKDKIESNIKAEAKRASYLVDDFNRLIKNYRGDVDALHDEFDKYLRGDKTAVLPNEFKVVAGKMRMHIDNLSQMLLRTGAVSVGQAETIALNLGQYVNRSYQVFDKKDWAKQVTDEMREAAKVDLSSMYRADAESKAKQTGMDADIILEDFINKKIDELISGESAATFLGISKTGAKNLSIMKERLDIPLSIRQIMGEYTDASQNYARTVLKIATLAENSRFLQSAREAGMGVFFYNENDPNRPKEFNTKIAGENSDTMSPLNGLYTTSEIAKAFSQKIGTGDAIEAALGTNFGPVVKSMYETYMKSLSSLKWLKTIGSVATHMKNITGNVWFMLSNGYYNPKKYAEAFSVLKNSSNEQLRDRLDEYIRAGIIDQSAALGEIKAMFADADFDTAIESRLKKSPFQAVKSGVKKLGQKMSTAYQLEDDFFKIISYENEKERYSNASFDKPFDQLTADQQNIIKEKASEITKNVLPNYARIPGLVKLLKAVPVTGTFVSFQAEAYRTAWNTVALAADELKSSNNKVKAIGAKRLAGIALSQAAKFGLMALMGTVVSGSSDDDDEDELKKNTNLFVAPWSKDSDIVLVNYGGGKMSYIDFSASDPHGGIKKAYNSIMSGKSISESFTNGLKQLLEPFMKEDMLLSVITDIANNKNSYGGNLYNDTDTDVNKINAIMDRVYKAFEPGTITSVRKVVGSDDIRNELSGQLTGYKISTVDVEKQLGFKMNELKDQAGQSKKLYSSAFYKFEDEKITAEELDKTYDQANKSQKETYSKMMDYMKAASFFGVDDFMIEDSMQGVGRAVINDLWYGETPDMKYKEVEE